MICINLECTHLLHLNYFTNLMIVAKDVTIVCLYSWVICYRNSSWVVTVHFHMILDVWDYINIIKEFPNSTTHFINLIKFCVRMSRLAIMYVLFKYCVGAFISRFVMRIKNLRASLDMDLQLRSLSYLIIF